MIFKLTEQQELCQQMAREFASRYLEPRVEEMEEKRAMPMDLFEKMVETGFLGVAFDEKYGGLGMDQTCYVLMIEELAKVSSSAPAVIITSVMFMQAVNMFGTDEQKMHYLPRCITGGDIGSFAFTEPSTGSDPKQLTSVYYEDGNHYILNGVKRFITNASYKGPIVVFANDKKTGATTGFIFEKECEGYSLSSKWDTMGGKASPVYDIFIDNIKVPKANVLGGIGNGFKVLKGLIAYSKMALCAGFVGNLGHAYGLAVKYAKEKLHRNEPIAKFPTIQNTISTVAGRYYSCKYLVYHLAESASNLTAETLPAIVAESGMVKAHVSDTVAEAARLCMTVLGAYGVCEEYTVSRCVRDAMCAAHIEGVSDMQRIIFGGYELYS